MATLTTAQLGEMRRGSETERFPHSHTRAQLNAAFQAVEDRFQVVSASFGTAIETAAPGVFSGSQKTAIVKFWARLKLGI